MRLEGKLTFGKKFLSEAKVTKDFVPHVVCNVSDVKLYIEEPTFLKQILEQEDKAEDREGDEKFSAKENYHEDREVNFTLQLSPSGTLQFSMQPYQPGSETLAEDDENKPLTEDSAVAAKKREDQARADQKAAAERQKAEADKQREEAAKSREKVSETTEKTTTETTTVKEEGFSEPEVSKTETTEVRTTPGGEPIS